MKIMKNSKKIKKVIVIFRFKFVRYLLVSLFVTNAFANFPHCKIVVEKITKSSKNNKQYKMGNYKISAREKSKKSIQTSQTMLLLASGRSGEINAYGQKLAVKCVKLFNGYELEFYLESLESSISTSLVLNEGQQIDLGSILKTLESQNTDSNIKGKNKNLSIAVEKSNQDKNENTQFFLTVSEHK